MFLINIQLAYFTKKKLKEKDMDMVNKQDMMDLETKLRSEYDAKIDQLNLKIMALEKIVNSLPKSVISSSTCEAWNLVVSKNKAKSQQQIDIINTVTKENKDRERRDKNVIIFGIKESTKTDITEKKADDLEEVQKLADNVHIVKDNIVRLFRIKSKSGLSPIIVELKDSGIRNEFIKRTHRKFKDIYVNPDLTESQRNLDKQLREECHKLNEPLNLKENWNNVTEYYVIRNNEVIKIRKQQFSSTVKSCSNQFHNLTHSSTSLGNLGGGVHQNVNTLLRHSFINRENTDSSKLKHKDKIGNHPGIINSHATHLKCFYTNATSLINKLEELTLEIIQHEASIAFISETWWTEISATNISGFNLYVFILKITSNPTLQMTICLTLTKQNKFGVLLKLVPKKLYVDVYIVLVLMVIWKIQP